MEESELKWFALKVFYNKVYELENMFKEDGVESYIPETSVTVERNGNRKTVKLPLISSLIFIHTTTGKALALREKLEGKAMIYSTRVRTQLTPVAIPDKEMNIFMLVTSSGESGVEYIGEDNPRYHKGDLVRVIDGPFKGSEGHIVRIKDNHRLVVTVKGLCAVATSYIPRCFLQKVDTAY